MDVIIVFVNIHVNLDISHATINPVKTMILIIAVLAVIFVLEPHVLMVNVLSKGKIAQPHQRKRERERCVQSEIKLLLSIL